MFYYVEKLDINEEINRLKHHTAFFKQELNNKDIVKGKKLGFISQEIGREINTVGSKANDVSLQKLVVQIKDLVEQLRSRFQIFYEKNWKVCCDFRPFRKRQTTLSNYLISISKLNLKLSIQQPQGSVGKEKAMEKTIIFEFK